MKKALFTLFLLASFLGFSQSDDNNNPNSLKGVPFGERLYFGGNIGASFGNITTVNLAPNVGYKINKKFSVGVGARYLFYRENYPSLNWEYSTSMYGGSLFTRYIVMENLFLHGEFESLNREVWEIGASEVSRKWVNMGLLGAGYRNGFLNAMLLYDVIEDKDSPYRGQYLFGLTGPPIILRVGFSIGL